MKTPVNVGQILDMNPVRPKPFNSHQAERAMESTPFFDTTPDHTRETEERIEKLVSALPKADGFISGAEVVERMKHLIGGDPAATIVVVDSISPLK